MWTCVGKLVSHSALIEALLSDSQTLPEQEHVVFPCQNLQGFRSRKRNCSRGAENIYELGLSID